MTPADNTHASAFGDDDPEPRGRPLECTICGSGGHNRSACPWAVEAYRITGAPTMHKVQGSTWEEAVKRGASQNYSALELRVMAGMQNTARKLHSLEQARAMQNAHPSFLEELAAHLDGQEVPKPAPPMSPAPQGLLPPYRGDLARRASGTIEQGKTYTPEPPPTGWRRFLRALAHTVFG